MPDDNVSTQESGPGGPDRLVQAKVVRAIASRARLRLWAISQVPRKPTGTGFRMSAWPSRTTFRLEETRAI